MNPRNLQRAARAVAAVGLAAALAAGCADEPDDAPATDEAVRLDVDPTRVMLHDEGETPGEILTFLDHSEDASGTGKVRVGRGFDQEVRPGADADPAPPSGLPDGLVDDERLELDWSSGPADTADLGEQAAEREVTYRGAAGGDVAEGFELTARTTTSGELIEVALAAPEEADDTDRLAAEDALLTWLSLPVVFPDQPVGVGARWSVDSRVAGEESLLQTTTYTLVSHDGDDVELDVDVEQRPALGALQIGRAPAGGGSEAGEIGDVEELEEESLEVQSSRTTASGRLSLNLAAPLPTAGEVRYTTRVVYGGEEELAVVQDAETRLAFGPDTE